YSGRLLSRTAFGRRSSRFGADLIAPRDSSTSLAQPPPTAFGPFVAADATPRDRSSPRSSAETRASGFSFALMVGRSASARIPPAGRWGAANSAFWQPSQRGFRSLPWNWQRLLVNRRDLAGTRFWGLSESGH